MSSIEALVSAVNAVANEADIKSIVDTFGLLEGDRGDKMNQILGVYTGVVEGRTVRISHRWYDRCRPFSIQPDGNKVELLIDGVRAAEGSFLDDH